MKRTFLFPALASVLVLAAAATEPPQTLRQAYQKDFLIGTALGSGFFKQGMTAVPAWAGRQFNSTTPCDLLKWQSYNPQPGVYRHQKADAYVDYGRSQGHYVVGHALFWHKQVPEWVFLDEKGETISREQLLQRMRERVRELANRYGSRINAWDVVNEAWLDDGHMRDSHWTSVLGDDFIEQAFRIAAQELPADVELIYNDFNMTKPGKRKAVVAMIRDFKAKGVRIDGVGMQGHWGMDHPTLDQIEASITAFADAGVKVHISELDIDVLPRGPKMDKGDAVLRPEHNPYTSGLPADMPQKQAIRYAEIFALLLKHRDQIKRVTFWGLTDGDSWLNNHPIQGRTNYPLLFDRNNTPKPAWDAVVNLKRTAAPSGSGP